MSLEFPDRTSNEIAYHVKLLAEAGLVEAENVSTFGPSIDWRASNLTWEGHEFLDTIRNETVWKRLLNRVQEKGGALSFEVMKELAIQISRAYFLEGGPQ